MQSAGGNGNRFMSLEVTVAEWYDDVQQGERQLAEFEAEAFHLA
jgi:hypothetical protein